MDFIERIFGIAPDGGDGTTEAMFVIAFAAVAVALAWKPLSRKLRRRTHRTE
ncbi:MAG: hypothetical protein ACJ8C6_00270 [Microvirga sp.]